ncbi:MAG: serine/threonine protein kinase [Xanthomonadales bacterium]|nr:serine/threonine protein kinase [Xanthomonadales bacterium]
MAEARAKRLQDLFHLAAGLPADEQVPALIRACPDDPDLLAEVLALLEVGRGGASPLGETGLQALSEGALALLPVALSAEGGRVGPWQIEAVLGRGGMGQVYRAVRAEVPQAPPVALKLVRGDRLQPAVLERFSTERRLLAHLDHPGICGFIDAGRLADGTPWVAMELIDGEPLLDWCDRRSLGIEERLRLLRRILSAVAHAHGRLVVHRDLKPGNVLVTASGQPKLLDFGIGKSLAPADDTHTATTERFLTPGHAAPEQLRGEPTGVACDVYALGALAYELLTGQPVFVTSGLRPGEIERLLLEVPPQPPSQRAGSAQIAAARALPGPAALARRLAGDLDTIILRCLRKRPEDRYASVAELDADIERHLDRRPIQARRGERAYRIGRFVARNRVAVSLGAALALAVIAGTLATAMQTFELARQRNAAVLERDRAEAVVEVLRGAFLAADPARVAGADMRVRQVLDAALPRLEAVAESQPALFVKLADTLAGVEFDLSSDSRAAALAQRALALVDRTDADFATITRLRLVAARALMNLGDVETADALLQQQALEGGGESPEWSVAQAWLETRTGRYLLAEERLRNVLQTVADAGPDNELATEARWRIADLYRLMRRFEEMLAELDGTLAWQLSTLADDHPRVARTQLRRMNAMAAAGRGEQALADLAPVMERLIVSYGDDSAMAALARTALGETHFHLGQYQEAVDLYQRAWTAWKDVLGEGHRNTLRAGYNLALYTMKLPDGDARAEPILREVLRSGEQHQEPGDISVCLFRSILADLLLRHERSLEALDLVASPGAAACPEIGNLSNVRRQMDVSERAMAAAGCHGAAPPLACGRAGAIREKALDYLARREAERSEN